MNRAHDSSKGWIVGQSQFRHDPLCAAALVTSMTSPSVCPWSSPCPLWARSRRGRRSQKGSTAEAPHLHRDHVSLSSAGAGDGDVSRLCLPSNWMIPVCIYPVRSYISHL